METFHLEFGRVPAEYLDDIAYLITPNALKMMTCCICQEVMENPRRSCENDHYNCLKCLEQIEETSKRVDSVQCVCPECREPLIVGMAHDGSIGRPVPAINEVLQSQLCVCPLGCGFVGPIRKLTHHKNNDCSHATVYCPYHTIGCSHVSRGFQSARDHLDNFSIQHQLLVSKQISTMSEKMETLIEKMETMERLDDQRSQRIIAECAEMVGMTHALLRKSAK